MLILALASFREDILLKSFSLMAIKDHVTFYPKSEFILLLEPRQAHTSTFPTISSQLLTLTVMQP